VFAAESDVRAWLRTFPELKQLQLINVCCLKKLLENKIATSSDLRASVFEGTGRRNHQILIIMPICLRLRASSACPVECQEGCGLFPQQVHGEG
jgi:hypothetical protein